MKKLKTSDHCDRLSELPDSLILVILSFLPMRDVVRTTLLSKRWKDVWTAVPCLNFDADINDSGRVKDFVNRALILWKGTKILKFKIDLPFVVSLSRDVDLWTRFAFENDVQELYISLMKGMGVEDTGYWAPQRLFSCSSIKKLSVFGCNLKINGNVRWNQLKSLRIDGVRLSGLAVDQVLSGAPQLEVLMLRVVESNENLSIRSSSLRKLMIEKYLRVGSDDPAADTELRIWAPNLETFEIVGLLYCKCLLMNVSSLTDAILGFHQKDYKIYRFTWNKVLEETLRQIFRTIHRVKRVTLSDWCIEVLGGMEKKYLLSSSSDVKFLKLNAVFIVLDEIEKILEIFPKLKMFVIEHIDDKLEQVDCQTFCENLSIEEQDYLEYETNLPKSSLLQLRTVEITWFLGEATIFPFIEFLLKHASMLEKMVIRARRTRSFASDSLFLAAAQKLLTIQRSFRNVELILCKK